MKKILLVTFLFISSLFLFAQNNKELPPFQLLPQPQSVVIKGEGSLKCSDFTFIVSSNQEDIPVLGPILDRLPRIYGPGVGIILEISDQTPDNPEGYTLEINHKGAIVKGRTSAGLFYACQTLEQLLEDSRDFNLVIPQMKITDFPKIAYRAIHLDTKHHLDRMEYYYRMMDRLARYKINGVIWEIEDKLRYTSAPEIGAPNSISKQEMQALCRYAKERYIDVSPLVQGLGHAGFILKHHPELRENPGSDWEFCPAEPKTYELQFGLYADALEAMPYGKYLHVGGDEITAIGIDSRCKATGKSAFELQMYWLEKVCNYAVNLGRTPIFWDDMPLKYGGVWDIIQSKQTEEELAKSWNTSALDEAINLFPKECVYMRWNYGDATLPAHRKIIAWYREKGLNVMGATAASDGGSPFLPRAEKNHYIKGFCSLIAENNLMGILATAWDDGSPHLETVWRGYIAQGEFSWNPLGHTVEEFKQAYAQREFGFAPQDNRMLFLDELEQMASFFDHALVTSGHRNPAWGVQNFSLLDLPDKEKSGVWSKQYDDKIQQAKVEHRRYETIMQGIHNAQKHARRNRYRLAVYEQLANLLYYPTQLILDLNRYDCAEKENDKIVALEQLKKTCDYFEVMRKNLETVYSQTRFMSNPKGYLMDMNHHNHLASKSQNSDWLFLYELPMVRKIKAWL